jgi:allantoicase
MDFLDLIDLAAERLGGLVLAANDEFFAPKESLLRAEPPQWREGEYTDRGKWMDGWETRRRRVPGDDWCIIRLGLAGLVRGVDIDTTHFKGNHPDACAIDVCDLPGLPDLDDLAHAGWREVLSRSAVSGDDHNLFAINPPVRASHIRLRMFPDGGIARLRVHGVVAPDWASLSRRGEIDLAAVEHGGLVIACSDMFFGSRHNLIMPGDARNMGDGWETRRRRGPGHDWTIIELGAPGAIVRVEVDTRHFKGNAPGSCSLEGRTTDLPVERLVVQDSDDSVGWRELVPVVKLQPHTRHTIEDDVKPIGNVTHVRFNIYPDGGVGRLRLFGRPQL